MNPSIRLRTIPLLALPLLLTACGSHYGAPDKPSSQLAFGVDMAQHGLWSEAMFRFREAERLDPNNPRIQNNIGVAYEAAGDYDKALESYKKALKLDPNSKDLRANYARFVEFYQGFKPSDKAGQQGTSVTGTATAPAQPTGHRPPDTTPPPPAGSPLGVPEPTSPAPPPPPSEP